MTTVITYMYQMGSRNWRIHLECSHKFTVTPDELHNQQIFIGKHVPCAECQANAQ